MQDRYAGDVGDFGKYGLLRLLCGNSTNEPLRLGVVWYRVPCESHNEDGKHLGYLQNERRFRLCDPNLFDQLKGMFDPVTGTCERSIAAIEAGGILPTDTLYYSEPLAFELAMSVPQRLEHRRKWLNRALHCVADADIVFLDPDNGIECRSVGKASIKGPKFTFWDEIDQFASADRNQSLVIYHHTNRRKASSPDVESSCEQVTDILREIARRYPNVDSKAVLYTRGTRRAFFMLSCNSHNLSVQNAIERLFDSPLSAHYLRLG